MSRQNISNNSLAGHQREINTVTRSASLVLAVTLVLSGCQRDISGKYLAKYTDGICWLQLVRTPDDHLTAQMETDQLHPDGKIERNVVALSGAANGDSITLSASTLGFSTVTLAGSIEHGKLTLIGLQPAPLVLSRSEIAEYQRELTALNSRSQKIVAAIQAAAARAKAEQERIEAQRRAEQEQSKAEQDRIEAQRLAEQEQRNAEARREESARRAQNFREAIQQTLTRLQRLDAYADSQLDQFSKAEAQYHAVTAKMSELVNRERQLTNPNAGLAKSQLALQTNQISLATDQIHYKAQSLQWTIQSNVQPVVSQVEPLQKTCREFHPPGDWPQPQADALTAACLQLANSVKDFREKFQKVSDGIAHLENTYTQEKRAQEQLSQVANRLQ